MHPIAFEIFGREIHWYGICIALGFLAATSLLLWKRKHAEMTAEQIFDTAMIALFTGILGARIFYVVQYWNEHSGFWWVFRIDKGGLVFYGGFLLAFCSVLFYAKRRGISFRALLDIMAPAIALAHAFGRIGCFLQGCCFGLPVPQNSILPCVRFPWTLNFPPEYFCPDGRTCPLHPTQLYESCGNLILCILLLLFFKFFRKKGGIAGAYLILYAILRFLLEFFRGDNPKVFLDMTPSQLIAIFLMIPAGLALLLLPGRLPTPKENTQDAG